MQFVIIQFITGVGIQVVFHHTALIQIAHGYTAFYCVILNGNEKHTLITVYTFHQTFTIKLNVSFKYKL